MRVALALFFLVSCATAGAADYNQPSRFYLIGELRAELVPYVREYLAEHKNAEIVLSTHGGSQSASEEIAAAIQTHGNVRCVVRDKAQSGGFRVLQACRVRAMLPGAVLGTHEPRMMISGPVDRQLAAVMLSALHQASIEWNAKCGARLKISQAEYNAKVRGTDWNMTAHEALLVGAVDQVVDR